MAPQKTSRIITVNEAPSDIKRFFHNNGYASSLPVLDKTELSELQAEFAAFENIHGKQYCQYSLHNSHLVWPWLLKLSAHPNILGPIKEVLGEDVVLLDSRFICKYPMTNSNEPHGYVAWHQDMRYWGVDGDVVSVWLAIDDAAEDNGCLQVIAGTHTMGLLEHRSASIAGNMLTSNQEIPLDHFDHSVITSCPLKAGQMSIHHGHLIHGSCPNYSYRRRCGYVIRFVATSCRPVDDPDRPRKFDSTVLLSGTDTYGNFRDNAPDWFRRN